MERRRARREAMEEEAKIRRLQMSRRLIYASALVLLTVILLVQVKKLKD